MPVHGYIQFNNIFEYSQSPWYRVSETTPDFEFSTNFTWENLISKKNYLGFFCKVARLRFLCMEIQISKLKFYLNSKSGGVSKMH